jgi:hypothetical protein
MIVLTISKGKTYQSYILKERLTMKLANWIAEGLIKPQHPLGKILPSTRFKSYCINSQGKKWGIAFSRKADPTYLLVRGRRVDIVEQDKAHIEISLEEVSLLSLKPQDLLETAAQAV